MKILSKILIFCTTIICNYSYSQLNFDGINVQGQFFNSQSSAQKTLDVMLFSIAGDTIRKERFSNIQLNTQNEFSITFGTGTFMGGTITNFKDINWLEIDHLKVFNSNSNVLNEIGNYHTFAVPYSYHSLKTLAIPNLIDLEDTPNINPTLSNKVLKFDGQGFYEGTDILGDTVIFAWFSNQVNYADSSFYTFLSNYSDSSNYSVYSDSSLVANQLLHANNVDSSTYVDTITNISFALGNWGLHGNTLSANNKFLGPVGQNDLIIKTNNISRLAFSNNNSSSNLPFPPAYLGFHHFGETGQLFNLNTNPYNIDTLNKSHFLFKGESYSLHGGSSMTGMDSLSGLYSIAWGDHSGTNGSYSAVFGQNTYGDSSFVFGTKYDAIAGFAVGKNCRTTYVGVAIGINAVAGFYRNVALGNNVTATGSSAAIAIGKNVSSTGATAWAAGLNLTANGSFSTALGFNASTNGKTGSFVFGDYSTNSIVGNSANHQFMVRADGGFVFYTDTLNTMGVNLNNGDGSWNMISDKTSKRNIEPINYALFSKNFSTLEILQWQYKNEASIHIGPMAQTFHHAFKVGETNTHINMVDSDGTTLTAIKYLNQEINQNLAPAKVELLNQNIIDESIKMKLLEQKINELYEKVHP